MPSTDPKGRVVAMARRTAQTAGVATGSQILAFVAGLLIIRNLDKVEYAQYAACISATAAITAIADSGIGTALIAQAARARHSRVETASIYASAFQVRRKLVAIVLLPGIGLLVYVLTGTGATWSVVATSSVVTIVICYLALVRGITTVEQQLSQRYIFTQISDAANSALRLIASTVVVTGRYSSSLLFLTVSLLGSSLQSLLLWRDFRTRIPRARAEDAHAKQFLRAVYATAPASVLLIAGEQAVNVVLVAFGNAVSIGEVAALTRFALAFSVINAVLGGIGGSIIARATESRQDLRPLVGGLLAGYAILAGLYVVANWLLAQPLLALLGGRYSDDEAPLLILAAGTSISNFATYGLGLVNHARGWLAFSWMAIPGLAAWLLFGIFIIRPSQTTTAAIFAASLALVLLTKEIARFVAGYRRVPKRVEGPTHC